MTIRAFIAIEIGKEIKRKLSEFLSQLKETNADVKWVFPENIHLTLKFIGYIEEETLPGLNKIINDAISCLSPFNISIRNIGAFPNLKKPRIIFVCVQDKGNSLAKIYEKLDKGVEKLGIKRESKKYVGHITLGRIRSQKNISKLINTLKSDTEHFFGLEKVNYISLMQSKLTPTGPIYTRLNSFMLN
ncbi:MAG: 2'-5' RNA ligase [Candidatus Scalindua rubra]|uniref:RNA 2',3'-cyclic phosphodiesterase n=1 Tax=Candidatus Scalindua rubra TaxID=1872076 RepID=A0A1E3XA20_9BACT|nr:MAG: 2'-5' RNA ligase [Candidatus Scalindua rubra]